MPPFPPPGALPLSYSSLTSLAALRLGGNSLSGTLPVAYSALRALEAVDLAGNQLQQGLPPEWSVLSSLQVWAAAREGRWRPTTEEKGRPS